MRRPVQFHHFKLTNNPDEQEKHMVFVQSLHKYTPVVEISEYISPDLHRPLRMATFVVVTAYQNEAIKKLKVDNNPFAAGLRQKSRSPNTSSSSESDSCNRKRPSSSPLTSPSLPPPSAFFPHHIDLPFLQYPTIPPSLPSHPLVQYNEMVPNFYAPIPFCPFP
ncbi:hypothetical protein PMAYCL1PPCAC_12336, partial [Pristionchus mayeri]